MTVMEPFLNVYHHVFCDKLYTGVQLARDLLAKQTYLTGAVKMTAAGLACDLSKDPRKAGDRRAAHLTNMTKTHRGTMYFRQNGRETRLKTRSTFNMPPASKILARTRLRIGNNAQDFHISENFPDKLFCKSCKITIDHSRPSSLGRHLGLVNTKTLHT